jgi:hypothetical protein
MHIRAQSWKVRVASVTLAVVGGLWAQAAVAQTVAGLEFDIAGDVDARLRAEIEEATREAFRAHPQYTYVPADVARGKLNSVVRGCFTSDCLVEAGRILDARLGLGVRLGGESQIYDWQLELFDLATGETLGFKPGTCELCGRAEVVRNYTTAMRALLDETTVPTLAPVQPEPAPQAETPQEARPAEVAELVDEVPRGGRVVEGTAGATRLRISVVPAEAEVYLNDELVGTGDLTLWISPGRHDVRFVRQGYRGLRETLVIGEVSPQTIMLRTHLSQTAGPAQGGVPLREPGLVDQLDEHRNVVGWSAIGAGAVFLAGGIFLNAIHGSSACSEGSFSQCPEIYNTAGAGVLMTLTGTALLTSGAGLLLWDIIAGPSMSASSGTSSGRGVGARAAGGRQGRSMR